MKRILSLLMIPLLIMSLTGCGTNYSSAVLFSGQTKWFGSKLLPDYEPVIPLDDIIPDSSIQNEPVDDFPTAMEPELPVEPAPSETAIPELPSSSEEESSEGIIAPEILPGTPAAPQPEPSSDTLVRVQDYIPEIRQALAYADTNNFTRQRIYDFSDAYLRYGTVKKLAAVCDELATLDLGILIWDAFRPLESQKKLWELCPDETYVSHPVTGTRSHCRGNTLDVTLVDLRTGEAKPIPTEYDNFTDLADRNYTDCAPEGALYAVILEDIMKKHGFEPYFEEWWHFTDTDDYPVEEIFHPTVPTIWTAICSKSMSMVKAPYSESVVSKIRTGEKLELLGWNDKYARVSYNGKTGYVMSCDIKPASENYFSTVLDVVVPTDTYTYDQMFADLEILHTLYPDITCVDTIGSSELGRDIPVIRIGDENAQYHVLLQGAMHGREHMTAWLLSAMADYWLHNNVSNYGDICFHIIPMSNPDGVTISQEAALPDSLVSIYKNDIRKGYTNDRRSDYARFWKANGLGEDINRNFPDGWYNEYDRPAPSSMNYPGSKPFSTAEARALRDYTLQYDFDATVSYHATGSLIFYEYGKKKAVNASSKSLARAVNKVTGYTLMESKPSDGAGYKDWAIQSLEIPSITIEMGCFEAPLEENELYSLFARNYNVLPAITKWLQR